MESKSYYQVNPVGMVKVVYLCERENFVDLVSTLASRGIKMRYHEAWELSASLESRIGKELIRW